MIQEGESGTPNCELVHFVRMLQSLLEIFVKERANVLVRIWWQILQHSCFLIEQVNKQSCGGHSYRMVRLLRARLFQQVLNDCRFNKHLLVRATVHFVNKRQDRGKAVVSHIDVVVVDFQQFLGERGDR